MAIADIKTAAGYTPNPLTTPTDTPKQTSSNAGDTPPPVSTASLAPQVASVVPGEVIQPQTSNLQPSEIGNPFEGIGDSLSGLLTSLSAGSEAPQAQEAEPLAAPPLPGQAPDVSGTPPKQTLLQSMAPEASQSIERSVGTAPVATTPEPGPNVRGYTSVIPSIVKPEAKAEPKRTMSAYISEQTTALPNPTTISDVVSTYQKNPGAFNIDASQIDDLSGSVGSSWNFGTMSNPQALVVHHTAGGGTRDGVISTFKERNFPAHFIIERDGKIVQVLGLNQKGQHTRPAQDGSGINNSNSWGVEIIAKNDSDLTPGQVQSAIQLTKYLEGHGLKRDKIVGHGQINSHKEATEGQTVLQTLAQIGV